MASLGRLTLDLVTRIAGFEEGLNRAERKAKSSSKNIVKDFDAMTVAGKTLGIVFAGLSVGKVIELADGYTQMAARIRNATSSMEEYNKVQNRVLQTANKTFRSLDEAQEVYLAMSDGMLSLGYSTDHVLDLVDSLSFAFTANATTAQKSQSAMDALSKSMAKGKVDANSWISIVSAAPNIVSDLAKETGRTEAAIRELGVNGKIRLDELNNTLIKTRDKNLELADSMENSLADGFTALNNQMKVFFGELNASTSATGLMSAAVVELGEQFSALTDMLRSGAVESALKGMGEAFGLFKNDAGTSIKFILDTFGVSADAMVVKWRATINELNAISNTWVTIESLTKKAAVSVAAGWDIVSDPFNRRTSNNQKQQNWLESLMQIDDDAVSRFNKITQGFDEASEKFKNYQNQINDSLNKTTAAPLPVMQVKADSAQLKAAKKIASERKTLAENLARERSSIEYDYADEALKRQIDYQREVKRLQEAGMTQYLAVAKKNYDADVQYALDSKKLQEVELAYNLYAFRMTEEEKLTAQARIEDMRIRMSREYTEQEKQSRMNAVKAQYDFEIEQIRRVQEERANALHLSMTMQKAMAESRRYDSFAQLVMTPSEYAEWDLQNRMSHESASIYNTYQDNVGKANELTDVEARNKALLDAKEAFEADKWAIEQEYALRSQQLQEQQMQAGLSMMVSVGDSMANVWGGILGEQSSAYHAMAAMSKGFAVFQAMINIPKTYSDTFASISAVPLIGPYIAAPMAAAAAATQLAQATMIKGVNLTGMAHSGIDNVPKEGTWLLDKGERVLSPRQNADLTKYLDRRNGGDSQVTMNVEVINQSSGTSVETERVDENRMRVIIRDEVDRYVPSQIANTNSKISKSLQRNTTARVNRA